MSLFNGAPVLITGGHTETARAIALALARAGAGIALTGMPPERIEDAAGEVLRAGGQALALPADLTRPDSAGQVIEQVIASFGRIEILVLISSVWGGGYLHEHNLLTWQRVLDANLNAPFYLLRRALQEMRRQRSGQVLVMNSESALDTYPMDGIYGVSLHALDAMAQAAKVENASHGIRVTSLYTGVVLSPNSLSVGEPGLYPDEVARWALACLSQPPEWSSPGPIRVVPGQEPLAGE